MAAEGKPDTKWYPNEIVSTAGKHQSRAPSNFGCLPEVKQSTYDLDEM